MRFEIAGADVDSFGAVRAVDPTPARSRFQKLPIERQDEIIDLAAHEFARGGFHGTSYNQLLDRLKLGKSSAYYYFDDKRDLFRTVIRRCYARYFEAIGKLDAPTSARAFWPFLERAAALGFAFLIEDPTAAGMMMCIHREPAGRDLMTSDLLVDIDSSYDDIIRNGQRLGAVRTDLPQRLLLEMVRNVTMSFDIWFFAARDEGGAAVSADAAAAHFLDVVRRMLRK